MCRFSKSLPVTQCLLGCDYSFVADTYAYLNVIYSLLAPCSVYNIFIKRKIVDSFQ